MFICFFVRLKWFYTWASVYLNLIHPRSDVEKAALGGDIVQQQDAVSFPEIRPGNTPESEGGKRTVVFSLIVSTVQTSNVVYTFTLEWHFLRNVSLENALEEEAYLSCPAVSQICRLVISPSTSIFFNWKSTPDSNNKTHHLIKLNRFCL